MRLIYFCFLLVILACDNIVTKKNEQCLSTKKVMHISAKEYHQDFILFNELNHSLDDGNNSSKSDCFKTYKLVYSLKKSNNKGLDIYNKKNEWIIRFKANNITENIKLLDVKNVLGYSIYNDNLSLFYSEKDNAVPIKRLVFDNTDFLIYSYEFYYEKDKPLEVIDY